MILNNEVNITINNQIIKLTQLNIIIIDDADRKIVLAKLSPYFSPLVLWRDAEYDNAGDYTQAQVEYRIIELLGDNPQSKLQSLIV